MKNLCRIVWKSGVRLVGVLLFPRYLNDGIAGERKLHRISTITAPTHQHRRYLFILSEYLPVLPMFDRSFLHRSHSWLKRFAPACQTQLSASLQDSRALGALGIPGILQTPMLGKLLVVNQFHYRHGIVVDTVPPKDQTSITPIIIVMLYRKTQGKKCTSNLLP